MIIVEGADGTGKTTLCKKLAKEMNLEYLKIPRHKNDDELNGFKFYLEKASSILTNTVVDRFHIGEMIYPRLYENDFRQPLLMWQQHAIERILNIRGAMLIYVNANYDFIEQNYNKRKDHFYLPNVIKECELFGINVFNSILFKKTYITTHTNDITFIEFVDKYHKIIQDETSPIRKYFGTGFVKHPIMIVGDCINKKYNTQYSFGASSGSSEYLHQALDIAGCKNDYYITNSNKGNDNDVGDLLKENFHINPIIRIALGQNAHLTLDKAGLKHKTIQHPEYHKRFHHNVYEYAHIISELIV